MWSVAVNASFTGSLLTHAQLFSAWIKNVHLGGHVSPSPSKLHLYIEYLPNIWVHSIIYFPTLNLLIVSAGYKLQRQELFTLKVRVSGWSKSRDRSFSWHVRGHLAHVRVLDIITSHEDSTSRTAISCLHDLLWNSGFSTKRWEQIAGVIVYCVYGVRNKGWRCSSVMQLGNVCLPLQWYQGKFSLFRYQDGPIMHRFSVYFLEMDIFIWLLKHLSYYYYH